MHKTAVIPAPKAVVLGDAVDGLQAVGANIETFVTVAVLLGHFEVHVRGDLGQRHRALALQPLAEHIAAARSEAAIASCHAPAELAVVLLVEDAKVPLAVLALGCIRHVVHRQHHIAATVAK